MIYTISNTYLDIKEREQERDWTQNLSGRDRKERGAQWRGVKQSNGTRLKDPVRVRKRGKQGVRKEKLRKRGRGDLEREKLLLDLIACTSAFKMADTLNMKDAKTIITSCFRAGKAGCGPTENGGGAQGSCRPWSSPRTHLWRAARGLGAEESQCILTMLWRLHGASQAVLEKNTKQDPTDKRAGFLFNKLPSGYSPSCFGPSDLLALFVGPSLQHTHARAHTCLPHRFLNSPPLPPPIHAL